MLGCENRLKVHKCKGELGLSASVLKKRREAVKMMDGKSEKNGKKRRICSVRNGKGTSKKKGGEHRCLAT